MKCIDKKENYLIFDLRFFKTCFKVIVNAVEDIS